MWRVLVFNLTKTIFIMFDNDLSSSWKFVNNTTFHQNMSGVILSPATHTWSRRNTHKFQKQYSFSHGGFKNKRNRTRPCKHYIFHSVYILLRHKVYMYTVFHTNAICDYKMKNNSWINVLMNLFEYCRSAGPSFILERLLLFVGFLIFPPITLSPSRWTETFLNGRK